MSAAALTPPRDSSCVGQRWWVQPVGRTDWLEVEIKRYDSRPPDFVSPIAFGARQPMWVVESPTHGFIVGISDNGEALWSKTPPSP